MLGSTSDRTRSAESLVCIWTLHLLYLFRSREFWVLSDQILGIFHALRRWLGFYSIPTVPKWYSGIQFLAHFPFTSPLSCSLPICQSCRKTVKIIIHLVLRECFIQERRMVLFVFEPIIGSSSTNLLLMSSWKVSFGC